MKRTIFMTFVFMIFGIFCIFAGCSQKAQQENILAKFDKQVVKTEELEKEISELPEWQQDKYKDQKGREEYLTLMAESRMLLQVANEKGLDKDLEIIKQIKEYKDQLVVKELVKREVDDKVAVNDVDIGMYYDAHKADYVEPEKVSITEITVENEQKAKETMEKIKGGADFTELAKEMAAKSESVGPGQRNEGKVTFSKDYYPNAQVFVDTAFGLEVGKMSDIIVQPIGEKTYYMIVRLDGRTPSRQQELSEVKDNISSIVEKDKKKETMDKWLGDLKTKKKFQLYPERLPKVEEKKAEGAEKVEETAKPEETKGEQVKSEKTPEETPKEEKPGTEEGKTP